MEFNFWCVRIHVHNRANAYNMRKLITYLNFPTEFTKSKECIQQDKNCRPDFYKNFRPDFYCHFLPQEEPYQEICDINVNLRLWGPIICESTNRSCNIYCFLLSFFEKQKSVPTLGKSGTGVSHTIITITHKLNSAILLIGLYGHLCHTDDLYSQKMLQNLLVYYPPRSLSWLGNALFILFAAKTRKFITMFDIIARFMFRHKIKTQGYTRRERNCGACLVLGFALLLLALVALQVCVKGSWTNNSKAR